MTAASGGPGILFLGTGHAARLHSKLLAKRHPEVRRFYWGRSPASAADLAKEFGGDVAKELGGGPAKELGGALAKEPGGAHLTEPWSDAVRDDRVDAVFVTTPPDTHRDMAVAALAAGKHVLVEKPAFLTSAEFDDVEAAARDAGRQVLVAENYYYKPLLRRVVEIIESGALGQVRLVLINAAKRQDAIGWRADPAQAGGGALFEGGIHWVSFLASLGLTIRSVRGHFPDAPPGHERTAVFVTDYEEGAVGVLAYSWEIPGTLKGLRLSRIHGTRSSLLFESNGLFLLQGGRRLSFPGLSDIQGYKAMLADFVRVLTDGGEPRFTLADARRDVELIRTTYHHDPNRGSAAPAP